MRKILALVLALLASVGTMSAITIYGVSIGGITYNLNSDLTAEVTNSIYHHYRTNVVIPASVNYNNSTYSVISIGSQAFYGCSGLKSVTIGSNVSNITNDAFLGCTGLTGIIVNSENTKYDSRNNCNAIIETSENSLILGCKNTRIPNSVTSIGSRSFYGCSGLTSIEIPEYVAVIGYDAFCNCSSLSSVTCLRETPASIGSGVFEGCRPWIYVPCTSVETYKKVWSPYSGSILGKDCSYTITFVNWNGEILQNSEIKEGEVPQYTGAIPEREDDEQYTYVFAGWSPQLVPVFEDATYTATYTSTPKSEDFENVINITIPQKSLRDGVLLIEKNGKLYNATGSEVK